MKIYSPITQPEDIVNKQYVDSNVLNISHIGTLTTSEWVESSGMYYQQITIDNMTTNLYPLAWINNVQPTNEQLTSWNGLLGIESFDGYVRFYATTPFATAVDYVLVGYNHN